MKKPDGVCESCKKNSKVIIDGRVRLGKLGPKGHWVFLCPPCHMIHGLGYGHDDYVQYRGFAQKYFEVNGVHSLKVDEMRQVVRDYLTEADGHENQYKVVLLGEIAIQLVALNENLKVIADGLQPKIINIGGPINIPEITLTEVLEGSSGR